MYKRTGVLLISLSIALAFMGGGSARAEGLTSLPGHHPKALIERSTVLGRTSPAARMRLAVTLSPQNPADLAQLLKDLYDPASPRFHQFLTPEQFSSSFAPSPEDQSSLAQYLSSKGLTPVDGPANGSVLDFEGAVSDVENAFQVQIFDHLDRTGRYSTLRTRIR